MQAPPPPFFSGALVPVVLASLVCVSLCREKEAVCATEGSVVETEISWRKPPHTMCLPSLPSAFTNTCFHPGAPLECHVYIFYPP